MTPAPQPDPPRPLPSAQFLRFVVSGGISAIADVGLLAALVAVGVVRVAATPLAFLSGAFLNYTLHRRFTFRTRRPASGRELFAYGCVIAFNMLLTSVIVEVLTGGLGVALITSKVITLPIVAASGFLMSRTFVFQSGPNQ